MTSRPLCPHCGATPAGCDSLRCPRGSVVLSPLPRPRPRHGWARPVRQDATTWAATGPGWGSRMTAAAIWVECIEPGCPNGIRFRLEHRENFLDRFLCPDHCHQEEA